MNMQIQLDNLYDQLNGIQELRGTMTAQTRKDFDRIAERLGGVVVRTPNDMQSFRV